ncbi:MAG: protein translocase subunit SecF [Anaerolineaceae bacterium]|nr:protein translocase subunit SecF [Anaerolineaceae bacterium]MCY4010148.1 protein translocase subunit SecF [Anaerolineaceae bacterium]MCY4105481.1 protein translocase subunit SecF [Chloroflexota bacterium]
MFQVVEKRKLYFLISASLISLGILLMAVATLQFGRPIQLDIDFLGGSVYEFEFLPLPPGQEITEDDIRYAFAQLGEEDVILQRLSPITDHDQESSQRWSVRAGFLAPGDNAINRIRTVLNALAPIDETSLSLDSVSPSVGSEVTRAAVLAILVSTVVITAFIIINFRQVPNAFRYGICAIVAMLHDLLVVLGLMALMSLLFGWEADALFLTAVLTILGFSVQDSIVVFDRIRENIPRHLGEPYETIVNRSIWETMHRSLATQLNAFFVMIAILIFGGETVKQFVLILLVGLLSGTYSSLFTAVPLLVAWEQGEIPFLRGNIEPKPQPSGNLTE